ncbi:hypothetical protein TNCV_3708831 [Trichonephila clavipes]|nr:hypothetical protein TNCV_3708831 [Trichonephila clavipes]
MFGRNNSCIFLYCDSSDLNNTFIRDPSRISASGVVNRSGSEMMPRDVLRDLYGLIFTGEPRNVLASRKDFVSVKELVSTSRLPDRNLLRDFGSPPIRLRALCIANCVFRDSAL